MPISKDCISSPLEAGSSLLEIKQLPQQLTSALDYVSARLARKGVHLSMIVVRKDIELYNSPPSPPQSSTSSSPARPQFSSTSSKSLSKHSSNSSLSDSASSAGSSASGIPSSAIFARSRKWPGLPSSPKSATPNQQNSQSSSPPYPPQTPTSMNSYGITLMQTTSLTSKTEKSLRRTIQKAEKRFNIGSGWLTTQPLTSLPACLHTLDLITRSLTQNEVLFTQDGLTLLSLDHLYTFKSALHTYSRTLSAQDLTTSVDSLRRTVLSRRAEAVQKNDLIKTYSWLGVSLAALVDVNEGYKTAYGGAKREGGVDMGFSEQPALSAQKLHLPPKLELKTNFNMTELRHMRFNIGGSLKSTSSSASDVGESNSPISTKLSSATTLVGEQSPVDKEVEVGESAKGRDDWGMRRLQAQEDKGPHRRGPMTPNGFEDITPVTKGEWCFLMVGEGWREGRKMAVETC